MFELLLINGARQQREVAFGGESFASSFDGNDRLLDTETIERLRLILRDDSALTRRGSFNLYTIVLNNGSEEASRATNTGLENPFSDLDEKRPECE